MNKMIIRLLSALAIAAVVTLTAGQRFTSPPAKIIVFVGTAAVAFVALSISNKNKG